MKNKDKHKKLSFYSVPKKIKKKNLQLEPELKDYVEIYGICVGVRYLINILFISHSLMAITVVFLFLCCWSLNILLV